MQMVAKLECVASRDGVMFGDRCGAEAAFMTTIGPQCKACAERAMSAISTGTCLAAMIADARGVPRQKLLDQFRRIQ